MNSALHKFRGFNHVLQMISFHLFIFSWYNNYIKAEQWQRVNWHGYWLKVMTFSHDSQITQVGLAEQRRFSTI